MSRPRTLCILGCGNLGTPILQSLLNTPPSNPSAAFTSYIACVSSSSSANRLTSLFAQHVEAGTLRVQCNNNSDAIRSADVVILAVDPAQVEDVLAKPGIKEAFYDSTHEVQDEEEQDGKLVISVVAGLAPITLSSLLRLPGTSTNHQRRPNGNKVVSTKGEYVYILRTLPNVCASVSQSLTAIEQPDARFPEYHLDTAMAIFNQVGKAVLVQPKHMDATTAVAGSTPAFWAVIVDAFIDAAVAVGLPRSMAQTQIYQSMRGAADMLAGGMEPGQLRDVGTSPEGCTIGGIMVMEVMGVRGALGKALRESVTIAREMGRQGEKHVNDTRR